MMPSIHNKGVLCFRCLDFIGWSVEQINDLMCNKCRTKEAEAEALKKYTKEVLKK